MSTEVLKDSLHFLMMGYAPINLLKAYFENESEIEEKRCYLEKILHEKFASNEIFLKNGHLKIMIKDILHDARQNFKSSEESTYRLDAFRWILGDEFFNTILYPILESRYGGRIREVVGLANFFEKKLNNKTYGIDNRAEFLNRHLFELSANAHFVAFAHVYCFKISKNQRHRIAEAICLHSKGLYRLLNFLQSRLEFQKPDMKITKEFRQLLDAIKEGKSIPAPNRNEANHGTGTYVETDTDIDTDIDTESSAENEIDIMELLNAATDPLTARRRSDDTNFSEISTNSGESRNTRNSQTRRQNRGFGM